MIERLKLWQTIVIITAILGLPLLLVTREYVRLVKELSLNNLRDQLAATPAIEHIGELTPSGAGLWGKPPTLGHRLGYITR